MTPASNSRALVIALSVALGASLLVIAFLLGRESGKEPAPRQVAVVPDPPALGEEPAPVPAEETRRWPAWADLEEWVDDERAPQAGTARIERRPDGTVLLSNRNATDSADTASKPTGANAEVSAGAEVSDYFFQMDLIRSEAGAGDPNAFAMDLIKAAMGGSTAGFDQLIDDTARMEAAAREVRPPPSCEGYHQANIAALAESRQVLESMKSALAKRDIEGLTTIARDAQTLQHKAEALKQMREQITASAR